MEYPLGFPVLTLIVVGCGLGGIAALVMGQEDDKYMPRYVASFFSGAALFFCFLILLRFRSGAGGVQFVESLSWLPSLGADFVLGADGLSMILIAITCLVMFLAMLASWDEVKSNTRQYYAAMLFVEAGLVGLFAAQDLLFFFLFLELTIISVYFLIRTGGEMRAATKFLIFGITGSVAVLLGVLLLVTHAARAGGDITFDMELVRLRLLRDPMTSSAQLWTFIALSVGFCLKTPLVPLHGWLRDAQSKAPFAASAVIAALTLQIGAYGFLRICHTFLPDAAVRVAPYMILLAVVGVAYGVLLALAQKDVKDMISYFSLAGMSWIIIGLFSRTGQGLQAGVVQMINHALTFALLFFVMGIVFVRRADRDVKAISGICSASPLLSIVLLVALLSVPGVTGGMTTIASIIREIISTHVVYAIVGVAAAVVALVYMLSLAWTVLLGALEEVAQEKSRWALRGHEIVIIIPLVLLIFLAGFFPGPIRDMTAPVVEEIVAQSDEIALDLGSRDRASDGLAVSMMSERE